MNTGNGGGEEARRLLEIAEKLLDARDLVGSKRFAERALSPTPLGRSRPDPRRHRRSPSLPLPRRKSMTGILFSNSLTFLVLFLWRQWFNRNQARLSPPGPSF
ncbi:hypothetical protein HPP92_001946 [Vanilla planifolia]|uniref:Uncharacterized protein n=1 Tax=Vanilla planifolia TaxID=51239 RepID=A0A835S0Q2_VANPL|nr:hypothetical protein HPP92_001946 [Vanilla planifolia]